MAALSQLKASIQTFPNAIQYEGDDRGEVLRGAGGLSCWEGSGSGWLGVLLPTPCSGRLPAHERPFTNHRGVARPRFR